MVEDSERERWMDRMSVYPCIARERYVSMKSVGLGIDVLGSCCKLPS